MIGVVHGNGETSPIGCRSVLVQSTKASNRSDLPSLLIVIGGFAVVGGLSRVTRFMTKVVDLTITIC